MSGKNKDRTVYKNSERDWVNKRNDASKASSLYETQKEAEQAAKQILQN